MYVEPDTLQVPLALTVGPTGNGTPAEDQVLSALIVSTSDVIPKAFKETGDPLTVIEVRFQVPTAGSVPEEAGLEQP